MSNPPVVPPPVIVPPPPGQKVVPFSGAQAQFLTLMADMTVDVIEMAAGTYSGWSLTVNINRSARPLLVRPASGAAVVFDGGSSGLLYLGLNGHASDITFDPTGGSFTIQNRSVGSTGIVWTGYVERIRLDHFVIRNCSGAAAASQGHCLYISSDGTHRAKGIIANGWDVGPSAGRSLNGLQLYHNLNVDGVTVHDWKVSGCNRGAYLWSDATGVSVDGWTIADCNVAIDARETAVGKVSNCHATNCAVEGITKPGTGNWTDAAMVDGGGNTWS